jgi:Tubulin like
MSNHLIIGLGGTGGRIIRSFRKIIYRNGGSVDPAGVTLEYLYIDSSTEMMEANDHSWKVLDQSVQLSVNDQIHLIGGDLKSRIDNLANYPQLKPWIGERSHWESILNLGAGETKVLGGQKRILGRFLFSCHIRDFLTRLNQKMDRLREGVNARTTVHIFAGLAGGTGSGCLIDVIAQIRSNYPKEDCRILVYTLLPERYPKAGWKKANYHANGYAALSELNALSVGAYRPHDLNGQGQRLGNLSGPFQGCYVISNENNDSMQFDVQVELPDSIAMFLYQKVVAGSDGKWPHLDRIDKWENQGLEAEGGERSRLFLSFGLKQITYPEDEIRDYLGHSLAQQACAQMLYDNWAQSYIEETLPFSGEAYVRQPQVAQQWCLTRSHFFLEEAFTLDEFDEADQQSWRPLASVWEAFTQQIFDDIKNNDTDNAAAILRKKCKNYFESGFSGGSGIKNFYQQRSMRLAEYATTVLARIERALLKDVFEGRLSLVACEGILTALRRQLGVWAAEWAAEVEDATRLAAKAKVKLDKNVEEFECLGPLARMFGLRTRILEAARDNAKGYFLNLSNLEAATFAQEFARSIEQGIGESLSSLTTFMAKVQESAIFCKDLSIRLKPQEFAETRQDAEKRLKGVWIRLFDSKEVETYLRQLIEDQNFQKQQAKRARDAVKRELLLDRLEFSRCAKLTSEGLLDCLTKVMFEGLREADLNVSGDNTGGRLRRLLSVSIVDKLNDRYHGNADRKREEIKAIVSSARDFVQFNEGQCSLRGLGAKDDERTESFAIAMPEAKHNADLKQVFEQCSTTQIDWVDTKQRRRHEITLLKFTQLFPLRYLTLVDFLRSEYHKLLDESTTPDRSLLELHTDREAPNHPSLFLALPIKMFLPSVILGVAVGSIEVKAGRPAGLQLLYDKTGGESPVRKSELCGFYDLGASYTDAISKLNVASISFGPEGSGARKTAWEVLEFETKRLLEEYKSEESRKKLQKKILDNITVLADATNPNSSSELQDAAAAVVLRLDAKWQNQ